MVYQIGHCSQPILLVKQVSWSLRDGAITSQPCLDSRIHFCIGELFSYIAIDIVKEYFFCNEVNHVFSVFFPTASLCHFRTRSELDKYLEASQIRERAIERINNVTGTYGLLLSSLCVSIYVLFSSFGIWQKLEFYFISLLFYMLNRKLDVTQFLIIYVLLSELYM